MQSLYPCALPNEDIMQEIVAVTTEKKRKNQGRPKSKLPILKMLDQHSTLEYFI
jgi:hypothetical protein